MKIVFFHKEREQHNKLKTVKYNFLNFPKNDNNSSKLKTMLK